ncbi:MFS transporter [Fodinicola acaciae]|uniref:MFS transporter n=1 Tax=Fodinicola acaciae TaxID=2681555 RepID=UPI0013D8DF54|nr:MFS transporter [Fodinicola acaciae]
MTTTTAPARTSVDTGMVAALSAAFLGCWVVLLPAIQVTLALRVQQITPGAKAAALSVVLAVGATVALVGQNVIGALSDRTTSRFGMRRPWLVAGAVLGLASLGFLAVAPNVPTLVLAWALVQFTFNVVLAALNPIVPDQIPTTHRGRVSAVIGLTQQVGVVGGILLIQLFLPNLALAIVMPGLLSVATVIVLVAMLKDRRLAPTDRRPFRFKEFLQAYWVDPRTAPDFAWAWISRFLMYCGGATLVGYQTYFLQSQFGYTAQTVTPVIFGLAATSAVAVVVGSIVFGTISDRVGRRKIFVIISATVQGLALGFIAFSPSIASYFVAALVSGIASGCYVAVDVAMVTEVLPSAADAGKDLSVFHLASVLPQMIVPVVAPAFLAIGGGGPNYPAFFLAGAVFVVIGAVCNQRIRSIR